MTSNKSNILGVDVDKITMGETLELIKNSILNKNPIHHVVVNAGKFVLMQKDYTLYNSVIDSDIINADGQSIVWASKYLCNPLPERVAGIDLMQNLVQLSFDNKFKCYFLGATEESVAKVVKFYQNKFGESIIAGYRNGYFTANEELEIAKEIANTQPDILFVAISSPKKEIFLKKYKDIIQLPFVMGVGGSFDVIAGITKRAPQWMQKIGLEWFYRFVQEPARMWKRYLIGNIIFTYLIFKQKFGLYKNPWKKPSN